MSRETDDLERRQCNVCGEYWLDTGAAYCPFCHSEDTQPMTDDEVEADDSQ